MAKAKTETTIPDDAIFIPINLPPSQAAGQRLAPWLATAPAPQRMAQSPGAGPGAVAGPRAAEWLVSGWPFGAGGLSPSEPRRPAGGGYDAATASAVQGK